MRKHRTSNADEAFLAFESERLDAWVQELIARGIEFDQPPTGMRYL